MAYLWLVMILLLAPAALFAQDVPGYEDVPPATLWPMTNQVWRDRYAGGAFAAEGDFDGDGGMDRASWMASADRRSLALFVRRAAAGAPDKVLELPLLDVDTMAVGIEAVPPGYYRYPCRVFNLKKPCWVTFLLPSGGIALFHYDQGETEIYYYWNAERQKFYRRELPH